ncbi:helix-turn-helix domain-containing protein [Clostridium thermosuccinogenes]|uniref:helix-turn-helix domain-containing protein n=1 Tax=Clostridium thermosuccinogenes TaxID=84032 RepID=UPI000CCC548F|nr:helix-turn-helix transcriptional regulator [Pseudoclostridium thermosuccinogenes]PNT94167.1 hypothetical protein CDQ83_12010 [Pseudoclostridium thermosuccinogenes]
MKDYIILTENIRNTIKNERKKHKIPGIKLSEKLGKSPGYVSHIEKGVIKKIEREDLENLFKHILNINNEELKNYINNLLQMQDDEQDDDDYIGQLSLFDFDLHDRYYRIMQTINDNLTQIYRKVNNQEDMLKLLTNFNFNLTSMGASFMLSLCGLPFYELGNISTETKKQIFNEILDIFNKYLNDNKTNNQ